MRALVMAGGGLKVGFQAGVLQVWLDEAGLTFDHADGASGGCFNLAMYCEGRSGKQIADAWRNIEPLEGIGVDLLDLLGGKALMSMDRFRENVLREAWGLDWEAIRRSPRLGTFNLCNFTRQRLEVVEQSGMDEDRLVSAVSLPMWFPPVKIDGDDYIDAVYLTDGNLEEAIRRGADEIWAIWTVSRAGQWRDGFVKQVLSDHRDYGQRQVLPYLEPHRGKQSGHCGRPPGRVRQAHRAEAPAGGSAGSLPPERVRRPDGRIGERRRAGGA